MVHLTVKAYVTGGVAVSAVDAVITPGPAFLGAVAVPDDTSPSAPVTTVSEEQLQLEKVAPVVPVEKVTATPTNGLPSESVTTALTGLMDLPGRTVCGLPEVAANVSCVGMAVAPATTVGAGMDSVVRLQSDCSASTLKLLIVTDDADDAG